MAQTKHAKVSGYKKIAIQRYLLNATVSFCLLGSSSMLTSAYADEVYKAEQQLLSGLNAIHSLELDTAISNISDLERSYPKYKLAQLLKADLLAAKSGQTALLKKVHSQNSKAVEKLLSEAEVRWQFSKDSFDSSTGFENLVLKSAKQKHIILVSLQESRLYLFERDLKGEMIRVADYYVTIGRKGAGKEKEGDLRTPIGVYHLVDLLPGKTLPDLYGVGALPLNYPNHWDKAHGKTGSGIWLHGVPSNTYTRAPKASRGCVVLNNSAMERLLADYQLPFSTPVVIADEKHTSLGFLGGKNQLLSDVKGWLQDNHHQVDWGMVSVYRYPNENNLYYITFPGKTDNTLTHQFWQRDSDGGWKVVVESHDNIQVAAK
ncbi:L,D-transpeptidase family protein [Thiomicrorhabdus lithotrophica]|uniref:L,D-transpeptidase family protein n=1 Tax=Thiomicrorhabdus lithotrophica TaxID=2949997 RepID=A0ABY8CEE1_9GAMM|nr:L,D-transpeptidase family protein [Thiomicrorhabdus lithotrophica]WEJ63157.1 L,D-transpeptidase family protein [Thiomicrorhabdus lithotrophica]